MKVEVFKRRFDLENRDSLVVCQITATKSADNYSFEFSLCDGLTVCTIRESTLSSFKFKLYGLYEKLELLEAFVKDSEKTNESRLYEFTEHTESMETVGLTTRYNKSYIRLEITDMLKKARFIFTDVESKSLSAEADLKVFISKLKQSIKDSYNLAGRMVK